MNGPPDTAAGRSAWPLVGAVVLLVLVNLLNNVVAPGLYLLWVLLGVVCLVGLASADGLQPHRLGLGRVDRRAAVAAVILAAVTAAVMLLGTGLPAVESAFSDDRVSGMAAGQVTFAAAIRAPLGTALFEELAFRGVLLAMLASRVGRVWGVLSSSLAFGLWHVGPALGIASGNALVASTFGSRTALILVAAVVGTALAGAFLCWLRFRYDHLVVPFAVHATSTSLGYVLAWAVTG